MSIRMVKGKKPELEKRGPKGCPCRPTEKNEGLQMAKFFGVSMAAAAGVFALMVFGAQSCDENAKRYWKSRTPACEGPRSYQLRSGTYSAKYGFSTEREFSVKKGETLKAEGKSYVVVGHATRSKEGTLVLQEKGGENFALIHSREARPSRFGGKLRFDGWSCEKPAEKPLAAKSE